MPDTPIAHIAEHPTALELCHTYLLMQLRRRREGGRAPATVGPAITLSHQAGSTDHEIAQGVANLLQATEPKGGMPWTVFDRNLVEVMLEEHHLPQFLSAFIAEDRRSMVQDTIDELLGSRIPSWDVVPKLAETVLHLAHAGHAIVVGRGANVITAEVPNVLHVRLLASLDHRIAHLQEVEHLTAAEATDRIHRDDKAAGRYIKSYFQVSLENDALYHLTLNTDRMSSKDASVLIAEAAQRLLQTSSHPLVAGDRL
jgi:cytidylate kinase